MADLSIRVRPSDLFVTSACETMRAMCASLRPSRRVDYSFWLGDAAEEPPKPREPWISTSEAEALLGVAAGGLRCYAYRFREITRRAPRPHGRGGRAPLLWFAPAIAAVKPPLTQRW